jgi:hypothetical protein
MNKSLLASLTVFGSSMFLFVQGANANPILSSVPEPSSAKGLVVGGILLAGVIAFKAYRRAQAAKA